MNRMMLWAWMLWSSYSLKVERNSGWGMHALVIALIKTRTETNIKITRCGNWGFERMHATKIEKPEHAAEKNDNKKKIVKTVRDVFRSTVGTSVLEI